jgi:hypothetical protein
MTEKEPKEKKSRLTPADWATIEEMWASGAVTLEALSEQFLVNPTFLSRELSRRGIKKGVKSRELAAAATEKVKETLVDVHAQKMKRVAETKDEHYQFAQTLAKLTFQIIANKVKNKQSVSSVRDEIRTIKDAMMAIAIARDERFRVLGLDRDENTGDEIPALIVTEMTAQEIEAVQNRHKGGEDDISEEELKKFVEKVSSDVEREGKEISPDADV